LIDEYEYLFENRFDQPEGFAAMRDLASKAGLDGFNAFSFWIAGAESWENFCTRTGSGELNIVDSQVVFLGGMDRESFHEMWVHETSRCPDNDTRKLLAEKEEFAYAASGGIPFYAKQIGSAILTTGEDPDSSIFGGHLREMLRALNPGEREYLNQLAKGGKPPDNSTDLDSLIKKGLIRKQGDNFVITMALLQNFLESSNTGAGLTDNSETWQRTGEIMQYKIQINNNCRNRNDELIFKPCNEDVLWFDQLGSPCRSMVRFGEFIRTLYSVIYEATKGKNRQGEEKTLEKLPWEFKKKNKYFIVIVGVLRDVLGGAHNKSYYIPARDVKYEDILIELLGSRNEPESGDFFVLQTKLLQMAATAMENLDAIVKKS
jgi:hypothetical protein